MEAPIAGGLEPVSTDAGLERALSALDARREAARADVTKIA